MEKKPVSKDALVSYPFKILRRIFRSRQERQEESESNQDEQNPRTIAAHVALQRKTVFQFMKRQANYFRKTPGRQGVSPFFEPTVGGLFIFPDFPQRQILFPGAQSGGIGFFPDQPMDLFLGFGNPRGVILDGKLLGGQIFHM